MLASWPCCDAAPCRLRAAAPADSVIWPRTAPSTISSWRSRTAAARIEAVRGRILYDFSGNACEGYALQFRQVSELDSGEGKAALSDLRSTTWEDGQARTSASTRRICSTSKPADRSTAGRAQRQTASRST